VRPPVGQEEEQDDHAEPADGDLAAQETAPDEAAPADDLFVLVLRDEDLGFLDDGHG
jgi:hypothetical protein